MFDYMSRPDECPDGPHRGPEGPNEDIAKYRDMPDAGWLPMFARAALTAALEADNHDPRS